MNFNVDGLHSFVQVFSYLSWKKNDFFLITMCFVCFISDGFLFLSYTLFSVFCFVLLLVWQIIFVSFIVSFSFYQPKPENDGKRVQDFFVSMEAAIRDHPLWTNASEEDIDCAMEVRSPNNYTYYSLLGGRYLTLIVYYISYRIINCITLWS